MTEVKKDDCEISAFERFFTEEPAGMMFRRAARRIKRDKRIWFCLAVYPLMYIAAAYIKSTWAFAFLLKHSMECFFALFFIFALMALSLALDVFRLLTLKAQGGKLKIKEQDGKGADEDMEKGK